jgi:hypothetical protein
MKNALSALLSTGIPETTSFGLERGIRKARIIPKEINAAPQLEDLIYKYAAGQSKQALGEKETATTIDLANKKLSETRRESIIDAGLQSNMLDTWKKQNNLASLLGLATTAITGLGGYVALKQQEKRDVTAQKTLDILKGNEEKLGVLPSIRSNQAEAIKPFPTALPPKIEDLISDSGFLWKKYPPMGGGVY